MKWDDEKRICYERLMGPQSSIYSVREILLKKSVLHSICVPTDKERLIIACSVFLKHFNFSGGI